MATSVAGGGRDTQGDKANWGELRVLVRASGFGSDEDDPTGGGCSGQTIGEGAGEHQGGGAGVLGGPGQRGVRGGVG
ncbi:hypothetical protein T07_32 [Trichinella nelsoni]|uniref:Uncharacterized protein n=1 Tax=Trichinella nelsoni TaxID=6336 RepID=A0A0V0RB48_9BILA|nr:hypothetical protein T07_32 [Trichinella nelsoni]